MPGGQRLARLAAQAAHTPMPLESLRDLRDLRRELDAFERRQVARALAAGASFGQIARSLGVSRQAAHRRFRGLAAPAAPLATTAAARRVLDFAREEAAAFGSGTPGGEHLLLASLRAPTLSAGVVLRESGATLEEARALVGSAHRRGIATAELWETLAGAAREARQRGVRRIDVAHLLIGALDDEEGGAGRTLRALHIEIASVRAGLAALLEPPVA